METVQAKDAHLYLNKPKRHKFGAKKCEIDGHKFASKAEGERYCELKILYTQGLIRNLRIQPRYELYAGIKYVGDFEYDRRLIATASYPGLPGADASADFRGWERVTEDVKGVLTPVFKIKAKLFAEKYGRKIEIVKAK